METAKHALAELRQVDTNTPGLNFLEGVKTAKRVPPGVNYFRRAIFEPKWFPGQRDPNTPGTKSKPIKISKPLKVRERAKFFFNLILRSWPIEKNVFILRDVLLIGELRNH